MAFFWCLSSNSESDKSLVTSSNPRWDNNLVLGSNPRRGNILVLGSSPEFDNLYVMGSNPKFDSSELKGSIPKEVKVNSIDWCEVLSWIPRGSCNNINWCRFRNFDGSDSDDEDDSLTRPVAEQEGDILPYDAYVGPSPPERPATPQLSFPPLPLRPQKCPKRGTVAIVQLEGALKEKEGAAAVIQLQP